MVPQKSSRQAFHSAIALATIISVVFFPTIVCAEPELSPAQRQLFKALEENLTGATLVGRFSVTGGDDTELKQERYELKTVRHVSGELWLFQARITYGDHDVTLPLTLPVRWAGDTPVISVDEIAFPGLGTYTARVMIYADHYAGFWSGGDHGGHLFGVVERAAGKPIESSAK